MDCSEPVDDYCEAWQADNLQIPENIPSSTDDIDQFFIVFEVERVIPLMYDDNDDVDGEDDEPMNQLVQVEGKDSFAFWAPCPRLKHENLPKERISSMLSKIGVPMHKQEFMVDQISARADEIAVDNSNKGKRVLPMLVDISVVTCLCYGKTG